jgi:hypothetical protein
MLPVFSPRRCPVGRRSRVLPASWAVCCWPPSRPGPRDSAAVVAPMLIARQDRTTARHVPEGGASAAGGALYAAEPAIAAPPPSAVILKPVRASRAPTAGVAVRNSDRRLSSLSGARRFRQSHCLDERSEFSLVALRVVLWRTPPFIKGEWLHPSGASRC